MVRSSELNVLYLLRMVLYSALVLVRFVPTGLCDQVLIQAQWGGVFLGIDPHALCSFSRGYNQTTEKGSPLQHAQAIGGSTTMRAVPLCKCSPLVATASLSACGVRLSAHGDKLAQFPFALFSTESSLPSLAELLFLGLQPVGTSMAALSLE